MVKKKTLTMKELSVNDEVGLIIGMEYDVAIRYYQDLKEMIAVEPKQEYQEILGALKLQLRILAASQDKYLTWIK